MALNRRHTTRTLRAMKQKAEKIAMVTAYDANQARLAEEAEMDIILVGDSVGMVMLGYDTTIPVTLDEMIHHAKAVRRGAQNTMMLVDLPFATYHGDPQVSLKNAMRVMQEAHADGLKLEGGREILPHVEVLINAGIPVCAHLGLTPQAVLKLGGYRVQGRDKETAQRLLEDARALEAAGAFLLVLECVPNDVGALVTEQLAIPTIGIGAGAACSGQVLVYHDVLGMHGQDTAKFVKSYASLHEVTRSALLAYRNDVKQSSFPTAEYTYEIHVDELDQLYGTGERGAPREAD
ncbi:3-methyl-2-oxobutanoate hydroxymethyltransferase [Ferroacidibacillus organovorans]|uniref:3-methyl-2-oxobutanoate hydroxymethyltransferase n=1 Tax=Ferroacidibacillus organovorans TaxID=1765683 RepID=A0A161PYD0_9BACL|nr:3-methyl-2-oxobutanoate hydroxymethyltransferase [Ferroacidibacillus organovorans]KYP80955.1 3-methyl-2-oxobutanoate hydroxymethyltransferase [Ferroacidibacillus organovorans]OAG93659.1 3-methyl-2-oxobutanoate hydroxymethyltransferase [Ferroacidibacillus organovorans]OPG16526.1 3-methyl-2-oxobutanoate hydroxymethyltransferase [Ferroacidibacillus organovorans]